MCLRFILSLRSFSHSLKTFLEKRPLSWSWSLTVRTAWLLKQKNREEERRHGVKRNILVWLSSSLCLFSNLVGKFQNKLPSSLKPQCFRFGKLLFLLPSSGCFKNDTDRNAFYPLQVFFFLILCGSTGLKL